MKEQNKSFCKWYNKIQQVNIQFLSKYTEYLYKIEWNKRIQQSLKEIQKRRLKVKIIGTKKFIKKSLAIL
jgi:hypothetical protein